MWQHAQSLPSARTVVDTRVEMDVNMVQGGPGTGGAAVPLEEDHPFLAPLNPTARQVAEFH
eukprot:11489202-Alexandrium_andersonii.AAC.1